MYSGSGSGIARIRITGDLDVTMLQKSTVSTEQNTEKYRVLNYCTTRNTSKLRWYRNASMKTQLFVLPNLYRENDENKQKEAGIGPLFQEIK